MITIVAGTNRPEAKTLEMAHYYKSLLDRQPTPVESRILDLAQLPADFTVTALYANSGKNSAFNTLRAQMDESDKYVFVVPEYNNSFPGVLKAFIDGLSYPNSLMHKKCALVGISDGVQGNALGLSHLSDVFNYLGLNVLAQKVRIPLMKKNFVEGTVTDPFIAQLMEEQARLLVAF